MTPRLLVALLASWSLFANAQPSQKEFAPKSGNGRAVLVISGQSGMTNYAATAQQIADAGFKVVLFDGNDFWIKDTSRAWSMLKDAIARAQKDAAPGKVGVVGYSLGGGVALAYAAKMPETVETVVAVYPLTAFIKDPADFVARTKVPVTIFAGTADTYNNCCLIATARNLAEAAKASSPPKVTLHEYPGVGHGFNLVNAPPTDRVAGNDALEKTIAILKQALPTP